MDYISIIQTIVEYIDANLCEKIDVNTLADKAGFSPYHFSRVFHYYTGYTLMEYVRIRRLSYAACQLNSGKKIIDIALEYGFETHSGFSKAFKRYYSASPEIYARHAYNTRPALPDLSKHKEYIPGGIIMEPKIISHPATKLAGYLIQTTNEGQLNTKEVPKFWNEYMTDGRMKKLHKESFLKFHAEYGACFPEDKTTGIFEYVIAVEAKDDVTIPAEYIVREMPAATYAVFSTPASNQENFLSNIQGTWGFIFNEWFPESGYEYAEGCVDYEYYDERCMSENGKIVDIYIPVVKKA